MRSITSKLLLAFLVISLLSVGLIVLSTRWLTEREFKTFLFDRNRDSILSSLEEYYVSMGTWDGVEKSLMTPDEAPPPRGAEQGRWFFTLVDTQNRVVLAGPGDQLGQVISESDVEGGMPVEVDGQTVGTMVIRKPSIPVNPEETAFLNRIKQFYAFSAAGVIALGILLAFLLSRTLTRPIRELTAATYAVTAGELKQAVPVRSRDELGQLAASFNQMNAELARSLELRRQMTADIAHELRTPISIILGHAEGVHDGVLEASPETIEIIREEAERLEKLVEDLRTLSRADAGELPIERQVISPAKLLTELRVIHNHHAEQAGVSIQVQVASDLPEISVDPGRMTQVLTNLVDNALRYTPAGGEIVLSAQVVGNLLEIRVKDNGSGIPGDELEHVFDRFYRSDPSRQREAGGSGLGLAIARSIVEKHDGRIWAESAPGEGTTILVNLPLAGTSK